MNKTIMKKALGAFYIASIMLTSSLYSAQAAPQPLEYLTDDIPLGRVEPEGGGTVYNVTFHFLRGSVTEPYAALEGHGIGKMQWPQDPVREDYIFAGWYDNPKGAGFPYSMDTPIYEDTDLYARWKYTGSGGYWPRPRRGVINGIDEGSSFDTNQTISISAEGYNMHLVTPNDQRFRWMPIGWKVSDSINGVFSAESPFSTEFSVYAQGKYTFYVTYKEEIFDGVGWQETGQVREVEELSFQVKEKLTP